MSENKPPHQSLGSDTLQASSTTPSKRTRRILFWLFGIGCAIPLVCIAAAVLLTAGGALSGSPGDVDENPAWSPDGRRIAFDSNRDGNYDVYIMNADGSEVIQLTKSPFALLWSLILIDTSGDGRPVWSPDGSRIAFFSGHNNGMMSHVDYDICTMDQDGANIMSMTNQYTNVEMRPSWSPDGTLIAFESNHDPTDRASKSLQLNWDIYIMNTDGSGVIRLSLDESNEGEAAWLPDGSRIAYTSDRDGNYDIYTMAGDGSSIEKLTDQPSNEEEPAWSPDGRRIAFASDRDGNWDIFVMAVDGSKIEKLTSDPADDSQPSWSPDGEYIAFTSDRDGDPDVYVMNSDGSQIIQLTGKQNGEME